MRMRKFELKNAASAVKLLLVLALITGLFYPLAVSGIAAVLYPEKSKGSMVKVDGRIVGSELIGQSFNGSRCYFQGRPSAAGDGYDAAASGGSNLGPANEVLTREIESRIKWIRKENDLKLEAKIPSDLVTASASGLDPHISPDGAYIQVSRIAAARHIAPDEVKKLVEMSVEPKILGIFGEPRVNVLLINIELDKKFGRPAAIESDEAEQ